MTNLQNAMFSLQDNFLQELEDAGVKERTENNNHLLKEHLKKRKVREKMKEGYLEMGPINIKLARDSFELDNKTFFNYEARLAECD